MPRRKYAIIENMSGQENHLRRASISAVVMSIILFSSCNREDIVTTRPDAEATDMIGPCAGIDCGGHGWCAVIGNYGICICDPGYHTVFNLSCEENDPENPCSGVDCGGHGRCAVTGGSPLCVCDEGYDLIGDTVCADINAVQCAPGTIERNGECVPLPQSEIPPDKWERVTDVPAVPGSVWMSPDGTWLVYAEMLYLGGPIFEPTVLKIRNIDTGEEWELGPLEWGYSCEMPRCYCVMSPSFISFSPDSRYMLYGNRSPPLLFPYLLFIYDMYSAAAVPVSDTCANWAYFASDSSGVIVAVNGRYNEYTITMDIAFISNDGQTTVTLLEDIEVQYVLRDGFVAKNYFKGNMTVIYIPCSEPYSESLAYLAYLYVIDMNNLSSYRLLEFNYNNSDYLNWSRCRHAAEFSVSELGYVVYEDKGNGNVYSVPIEGGEPEMLCAGCLIANDLRSRGRDMEEFRDSMVSPDGSRVILSSGEGVFVVPVAGGEGQFLDLGGLQPWILRWADDDAITVNDVEGNLYTYSLSSETIDLVARDIGYDNFIVRGGRSLYTRRGNYISTTVILSSLQNIFLHADGSERVVSLDASAVRVYFNRDYDCTCLYPGFATNRDLTMLAVNRMVFDPMDGYSLMEDSGLWIVSLE